MNFLYDNIEKLKELALRSHYYCEDPWYSCPKAPDGCANDCVTGCNCGADEHNEKVDKLMEEIRMEYEDMRKERDFYD